MLVKVLKTFVCARDAQGLTTATLRAGEICEVRDDIVEGLRQAGFVGDVPRVGKVEEIPAPPSAQPDESEDDVTAPAAATNAGALALRHIGRGKFAVYRGDERLTAEPMTKDEAGAALAAMSP